MIGFAKMEHGLYVLEGSVSFPLFIPYANSSVSSYLDVWHYRLRHLSNNKMHILNKLYSSIPFTNCNTPCTICPITKQKKPSFLISTSISSYIFQLVDMDIWGPLFLTSIHGHKYFLTMVDDYSRHT